MANYIQGNKFAETLSKAADDFCAALIHRWREEITKKLVKLEQDGFPRNKKPEWDFRFPYGVEHVPHCIYVKWILGGQKTSLDTVTCPGDTGEFGGGRVHCRMGEVLARVEEWAWSEREDVYSRLPLFDMHDVGVLDQAHEAFLRAGRQLGMEAEAGSDEKVKGSFQLMTRGEVPDWVGDLAGKSGLSDDWWAGWTGLAASRLKDGFFESVIPTLNNQAAILGTLANLYAARAAIAEMGRNNTLNCVQMATKSFKETQPITTNLVPMWKVVQGIGTLIQIPGAFFKPVGAVGAAVNLVGFMGENLIPTTTAEGYKHDLAEALNLLDGKIREVNLTIADMEREYVAKVGELESAIYGVHSYNLELYDLTKNDPHGDTTDPGATSADIGKILKIARVCYQVGDGYAGLLPTIDGTLPADEHLKDKDGVPTSGDTALLAIREMLVQFVKTTCGRYMLAGNEIKAAAELYAQTDASAKGVFDRIMAEWHADPKKVGPDRPGYDRTLEDEADSTERPTRDTGPYEGGADRSPEGGGGDQPGHADKSEYV